MSKIAQEPKRTSADTGGIPSIGLRRALVSESTAAPEREQERDRDTGLIESILDNLPAWAFVALAIAALYLVWASLTVLDKFVNRFPGVAP